MPVSPCGLLETRLVETRSYRWSRSRSGKRLTRLGVRNFAQVLCSLLTRVLRGPGDALPYPNSSISDMPAAIRMVFFQSPPGDQAGRHPVLQASFGFLLQVLQQVLVCILPAVVLGQPRPLSERPHLEQLSQPESPIVPMRIDRNIFRLSS
jgi:hypothetical protein